MHACMYHADEQQIDPITRGRVCTIQLDSRYRLKDIDDLEIIAHSFPGLRTISGDGYRIDLKPDRLFLSRFTEMCENLHNNTEAYRGPHSWENLILKWQSFQIPTSIIIGSSDSAILFKCDLGNLTHTAMGDAITAMRKLDAAPQNRLRDGIPNPKLVAAVWRLDLSNLDTLGRLVRFVNEGSLCGIDRVPRIDLVHDDFNPATGENKFQGTVGIDRHPAARLLCDQLMELDQRTHNVSLSVRDPNLGLGEVALVLLTMLPFIRTRKSFGFSFILGRTAISNVSNRLSNGIANIDIDVSVKANTGKIDKPQMCIAMLPKQVIGGAAINTGRRMPKEMKAFGNVIAPLVDKDSDVEFRMHDRHFDGPEDDLEVWRRSFVRAVQAQRDVKVDDEG